MMKYILNALVILLSLNLNAQLEKPKPPPKPVPVRVPVVAPVAPAPKVEPVKKVTAKPSHINAQKVKAKLIADSVSRDLAYYYRINKVKQVTNEGGKYKYIEEVDRYGNITKVTTWTNGKLTSTREWEFDEFGNWTKEISYFYREAGSAESDYITTAAYIVSLDGLSENLTYRELVRNEYDSSGNITTSTSSTTNEYNEKGLLVKSEETGTRTWCSDGPKRYKTTISYSYNAIGKVISHDISVVGGCDGSHSENKTYVYDETGSLTKMTRMVRGAVKFEITLENNADGKPIRSTNRNSKNEITSDMHMEYNAKGLPSSQTHLVAGVEELETQTYTYY